MEPQIFTRDTSLAQNEKIKGEITNNVFKKVNYAILDTTRKKNKLKF